MGTEKSRSPVLMEQRREGKESGAGCRESTPALSPALPPGNGSQQSQNRPQGGHDLPSPASLPSPGRHPPTLGRGRGGGGGGFPEPEGRGGRGGSWFWEGRAGMTVPG